MRIFIFIFILSVGGHLSAQEVSSEQQQSTKTGSGTIKKLNKKKKAKSAGRSAVVKADGAAVYEAPSFDSPVLEYLDRGKKVRISKKLYPGIGIGAFFKVKIRKGAFGYITDTDVVVGNSGNNAVVDSEKRGEDAGPAQDASPFIDESEMMKEDTEEGFGESAITRRYIGPAYYSYNYSEKISGATEASTTSLFGLKLSGATPFFGGMPLDINLIFTTSAPDFYTEISSNTSGFMLIGDALVMLPILEKSTYYLFYGLGLMSRYSSWSVKLKSQQSKPALDSQEWAIGVAATVGGGFNIGPKTFIHVDGRYYFEKQKYLGFGAAIQFKY